MNEEESASRNIISLSDLLHHVSKRPALYVGTQQFNMAAAFIEGCSFAISVMDPDSQFPNELKEFNIWLANRLNFPKNCAWWNGLKNSFPEESETFKQLILLFEEFKSKTSTNHS